MILILKKKKTKAETNYLEESALRLFFLAQLFASSEMFRCRLWVISEKKASDTKLKKKGISI